MFTLHKKNMVKILIFGIFINFTFLATHSLWNRDETRYAEVAREMIESGDWITPHLYYLPYLAKPILSYYFVSSSFLVFGENEFGARFWCACFGVLTAVLTYLIGIRFLSPRSALFGSFIFLTTVLQIILTRFLTIDMMFTFFITLSYYSLFRFLENCNLNHVTKNPTVFWGMIISASTALAIMLKGPLSIILIFFPTFCYLIFTKKIYVLTFFPYGRGFVLFLLLLLPWHFAIYRQTPQFYYFFYYTRNWLAFFDPSIHHTAPWYAIFMYIFFGFLPWSFFFIFSLFKRKKIWFQKSKTQFILIFWVAINFLFFSLSSAKLPSYVLPLFPILSIITASFWEEENQSFQKIEKNILSLFFLILLVCATLFPFLFSQIALQKKLPIHENFYFYIHIGCIALILTSILSILSIWKKTPSKFFLLFVALFSLSILPILYSIQFISGLRSSKKAVLRLKKILRRDDPVFVFHDRDFGAFFYLKKRLVHIGDPGEMKFSLSLKANPTFFRRYSEVPTILKTKQRIYILCHYKDFKRRFQKLYDPHSYFVLFQEEGYFLISNFPSP